MPERFEHIDGMKTGRVPSQIEAESEPKISEELCTKAVQPLIPKIFHQVWIDFGAGKEPTSEHLEQSNRLIALHPGWHYILWREQEIVGLIKEHFPFFLRTFNSYDKQIKKHDSGRLVILFALGGVYLDHDYIPVKNIEEALGTCTFFASNEENDTFVPGISIMGSVAKNSFFPFALHMRNLPEIATLPVLNATGPAQFASALKAYMKSHQPKGFKLYHPKFFNPFSWKEGAQQIKNYTLSHVRSRFPDCFFYQSYEAAWYAEYNITRNDERKSTSPLSSLTN